MLYSIYPFQLPSLPYDYDALEPYIDQETMHYHHDKHFKGYVDNLNKALAPYPNLQQLNLIQLLQRGRNLPAASFTDIMHNAGGVYNHSLFFENLAPENSANNIPHGMLLQMIRLQYGSFEHFKNYFSEKAADVFGSGWTYLVLTSNKNLRIVNFKNQDTPVTINASPIILFDVWEHAYYLKYRNSRKDYIENLWNIINFPKF